MSFNGFDLAMVDVGDVCLRVRSGGSGPPLLLLHGAPQTHMMWAGIADRLARDFTVIAPDLRGYGRSDKPAPGPDQQAYSKRTMARDAIALMAHFGFDRFAVAGHDRGGRVGYRLALDHPQAVTRLSILDIVPTADVWLLADDRFALGYWHWGFLAQPAPFPERAIQAVGGAPFFLRDVDRAAKMFGAEAARDYQECLDDPETVRGICEDYRAGAGIDRAIDMADRGSRKIGCPVQILWGAKSSVGAWYDVPSVWAQWADDLRFQAIDGGHFIVDDQPDAVLAAFQSFFGK